MQKKYEEHYREFITIRRIVQCRKTQVSEKMRKSTQISYIINITGKLGKGEMIKKMLKRREECDLFHQALFAPVMSTDVSQVGVTLFPSF